MRPELFFPRVRTQRAALLGAGIATIALTAGLSPVAAHAAPSTPSSSPTTELFATTEFDVDADGNPDLVREESAVVDRSGNLLSSREVETELPSGEVRSDITSTYSYDDRGQLTQITIDIQALGAERQIVYVGNSYDARGELVETVQAVDRGADGTLDESFTSTFSGSQRELSTTQIFEFDGDGDGIAESVSTLTTSFDRQGNQVGSTQTTVSDDAVSSTSVTVSTYSARGALLTQETTLTFGEEEITLFDEYHYSARGDVIEVEQFVDGVMTGELVNTFDRRGDLVTNVASFFADGVVVQRSTTTSSYGKLGQVTGVVQTEEIGNPLVLSSTTAGDFRFDRQGNETMAAFAVDQDGDGNVDERRVTERVFDQRGRAVLITTRWDNDNDGAVDASESINTVFAKDGTVHERVIETDNNGDGIVDERVTLLVGVR